MSLPAIRVENVSKQYQIGARAKGHTTFREALSGLFTNPVKRLHSFAGRVAADEYFWALKDVSFEVQPGEVVGIIGRNGAGKSTLLKVLSQITEPTEGRVEINGRVASLLEVGTGFHPELTGRENIFLNGSILGMSRTEVRLRFDEIVEFSGIEKFLDTPIKRYSSGMTVRLAFAVAAHLEPEILVIDEVLAVGDAAFQEKCLKKMDSVASGGRTVLFVSHQMQAVANLCHTAIELKNGQAVNRGIARQVVDGYLTSVKSASTERIWSLDDSPGDEVVRLLGVRVEHRTGASRPTFPSDEPIFVVLNVECFETPSSLCIGLDLLTSDGTHVLRSYQTDAVGPGPRLTRGRNSLRCEIPAGLLNGGGYQISPRIGLHNVRWCVKEDCAVQFQVALSHGRSAFWNSLCGATRGGVVAPVLEWRSS
jgi:lipopolysaccharide transport system ATP-binding protein